MLQPLILSAFLLVIALLQPAYPSLENLPLITVQNAASLTQVAAIGSDTLDNVLWSPDGQILAAVTSGQVVLYKVDDLKSAFLTIPHHFDEVISFEADGHLNVGDAIWDIQKGTSETKPSGFSQLSPSGRLNVSSTTDDKQTTVTITDSRRAKTTPLLTGILGTLEQVVFSPDEQYGVVQLHVPGDGYDAYDVAQLWNIKSGTLVATLEQALEKIELITFHANGRLLVTTSTTDAIYGGPFEDVRVWDGHTGLRLNSSDQTNLLPVWFSPNKQLMVYALPDGLSLWSDHEIGKLSYQYQSPSSDYKTYAQFEKPLFSPDGKSLLAINERQIMVWDTNAAKRLGEPRLILENGYPISDYFFNQKGNWLIVLTRDNKIRVWDFTKRNPVIIQVFNNVSQGQISPDSKWIWGYSEPTRNRVLIDANTGEILQTLPANTQLDPQWKYATYWSQDNISLVDLVQNKVSTLYSLPNYLGKAEYLDVKGGQLTFTSAAGIQVYDAISGALVFDYKDSNASSQYSISANGKFLLSVQTGNGNSADIRQTDQLNTRPFQLNTQSSTTNFFLMPDEKTLATTAVNSTLYGENIDLSTYSQFELWDIAKGQLLAQHIILGEIQASTVNTRNHLLVLGSATRFGNASINLIDLNQPQTLLPSFGLPSHDNPVFDSLQFSPDGQYLAAGIDYQNYGDGSAVHDYTVMLLNVKQLQQPANSQTEQSFIIQGGQSPQFSPNNQFLFVFKPAYVYGDVTTEFELWSLDKQAKLASVTGDDIAAFSHDSALIAVHNQTRTDIYSMNDLSGGQVKPLVSLPDNEGRIKDLAFSTDGKSLYLIEESRVRVYGVK